MQIKKKPIYQTIRRAAPGETVVSTIGPQVVPENHVVVVGSETDSWPVSYEYLLHNCEPADAESEALFAEIRETLAVAPPLEDR